MLVGHVSQMLQDKRGACGSVPLASAAVARPIAVRHNCLRAASSLRSSRRKDKYRLARRCGRGIVWQHKETQAWYSLARRCGLDAVWQGDVGGV